ncbi:MAG: leucine-rich repeat domain-containing protein [Promethearchaeota archaeon]
MLIFISTKKTQVFRDSDFIFVPEDQIVMFGSECDYLDDFENDVSIDKDEYIDGCCGCHRSMMGVLNNKSTTTMKVKDINISRNKLFDLIHQTYERAGLIGGGMNQTDITDSIINDIEAILKAVEPFNEGDIVERRGDKFQLRNPDFDPFHIEKSIISEIETKINKGLLKKKNVISPSNEIIYYRNAQISASEARSLQELEILLNKNFKLVENVEENRSPSFSITFNHVSEINLYNMGLKSLPNSFKNLFKLKKLNLKFNNLRVLQDTFGNLESLELLILENNKLKYLPETIGSLKSLVVLELHVNHIIEIPESIGNLLNLKVLNLCFNKLKSLPKRIGDLQKLQVLDVGNNQIISIPVTLGNLKELKKLFLNINNLNEIPDSVFQLQSLEELYLNNNKISKIPEDIGNLTTLKELYLPNNNISTIPESIISLESLKELNLRNNPIKITNDSHEEKLLNLLKKNGVDITL